ncbi:ABC transporter ATP-binding protein [Rhodococcus koreensis]
MAGTGTAHLRSRDDALLRVEDLTVKFRVKAGLVHAVSGISFDVLSGETVGLVGESGCGKSTTGKAVMNLPNPHSGLVQLRGTDISNLGQRDMRAQRRHMQMIFQDPISSLNPRRRVRDIIAEPLRIARDTELESERVAEIMEAVGLHPNIGDRRPHEFSGGQCQRISIARALILRPDLLICDEPVSALDVSVQAQIINLLEDLKEKYALSYLFVAHDLAVVRNVSDRVIVMYMGKICEVAQADSLYSQPRHPYTQILLRSVPGQHAAESHTPQLPIDLPSPLHPPSGCRFRTQCPFREPRCEAEEPTLRQIADGQYVACHLAE